MLSSPEHLSDSSYSDDHQGSSDEDKRMNNEESKNHDRFKGANQNLQAIGELFEEVNEEGKNFKIKDGGKPPDKFYGTSQEMLAMIVRNPDQF